MNSIRSNTVHALFCDLKKINYMVMDCFMYSKFSTLIKLCVFLYTKICTFLSHKRHTFWITSMSPYDCLFHFAVFLVCLGCHEFKIVSASNTSLFIQLSSVHFHHDRRQVYSISKTSFWSSPRNVKALLMAPITAATFMGLPLFQLFSPVCVHPI